ncbi:MAG TPA: dihydroorotate dehydrogenase-like protein [Vicinamibacterales bacterium]|nr:dihydroorotate dehydrogenase-like protein [Vicinamibacterales bacterium]
MDLTTSYLGLPLAHPLVTGASPLVDDLDVVRRLEDAGAAAITMHSLFEEQITAERDATWTHVDALEDGHAEATSYFPRNDEYRLGPDQYLEQIRRIKAVVSVPVIASLNGTTGRGWTEYATAMQQAGADALELNVYMVATDLQVAGEAIEQRVLDAARLVRAAVTIPVAVKLSPFFSSIAHLAGRLDDAGVNGLVVFNRFYQPDIDIEQLDVVPHLRLSDSSELLLRLRWLAILSGRVRASLACSGGVHTADDAVKAIMAGAHAVQLVSVLLHEGPERLSSLRRDLERWMTDHEYTSVEQMRGSMSLGRCPDPAAFERGNYVKLLQTWRPR